MPPSSDLSQEPHKTYKRNLPEAANEASFVSFAFAGVAKLADAPDLGSGGAILRGSSPLSGKCFIISELKDKLR